MNVEEFKNRFNLDELSAQETDLFNLIPNLTFANESISISVIEYLERLDAWKNHFVWHVNTGENSSDKRALKICLGLFTVCHESQIDAANAHEELVQDQSSILRSKRNRNLWPFMQRVLSNYNFTKPEAEHLTLSAMSLLQYISVHPTTVIASYLDQSSLFNMSRVNREWAKAVRESVPFRDMNVPLCDEESTYYPEEYQEMMSYCLQFLSKADVDAESRKVFELCQEHRNIFNDLIDQDVEAWETIVAFLKDLPCAARIEFLEALPTSTNDDDDNDNDDWGNENFILSTAELLAQILNKYESYYTFGEYGEYVEGRKFIALQQSNFVEKVIVKNLSFAGVRFNLQKWMDHVVGNYESATSIMDHQETFLKVLTRTLGNYAALLDANAATQQAAASTTQVSNSRKSKERREDDGDNPDHKTMRRNSF